MSWQTLTLIAAAALFLFDFQNMLAWSRRRTLSGSWRRDHDYTLVVPLYGDPRYFEGRRQLLRYQSNVLVAIDVSTPTMRVPSPMSSRAKAGASTERSSRSRHRRP